MMHGVGCLEFDEKIDIAAIRVEAILGNRRLTPNLLHSL
jgi:hypothetical protein